MTHMTHIFVDEVERNIQNIWEELVLQQRLLKVVVNQS